MTGVELLLEEALLAMLVIAFTAWAGVVWRASRALGDKFDRMRRDYHEHSMKVEQRLTRLEEREDRLFEEISSKCINQYKDAADGQ